MSWEQCSGWLADLATGRLLGGLLCVELGHEPPAAFHRCKTWKWENLSFIFCLFVFPPENNFWKWGTIYRTAFGIPAGKSMAVFMFGPQGGKTLSSAAVNHLMPAPDLSPTDWLWPRLAWHSAIVGLNLRISSANLALCTRPPSVYSSISSPRHGPAA